MDYSKLVEVYETIEGTSKRLEKTYFISKLLKTTPDEDIEMIILLLQGRLFPPWDSRELGMSSKLIVKAINLSTGMTNEEIESEWKKSGDLGLVALKLLSKKKQQTLFSAKLSVEKVFANLKRLSELEGEGTVSRKVQYVSELLTSASPLEGKYILRTVNQELRAGVGEGIIRDAIMWANFLPVYPIFHRCESCKEFVPKNVNCLNCSTKLDSKKKEDLHSIKDLKVLEIINTEDLRNKDLSKFDVIVSSDEKIAREIYNWLSSRVQEAYDVTSDYALVAKAAKRGLKSLENIQLEPFHPIKAMLYIKSKGIGDAFERVGKPAAFEYKYDGFRLQVHKDKDKVLLFTRRLEDVTNQFPDVVSIIKSHIKAESFIIDSEVIGIDVKTGKYLPFQDISQRIKRKYDIKMIVKEVPVCVNIFDIMEYEGQSLLKTSFEKRRKIIEKIVVATDKIRPAKQLVTDDEEAVNKFYQEALNLGNEGLMAKNLSAIYKPGSRVGYGVKIKPTMESMDLVIVGADWGEGKRATWLTSFTIACIDDNGSFLEMGKVGTGFKEKEEAGGLTFDTLTELLRPLIIKEEGTSVTLRPEVIIEVKFEEIQKSSKYSSGFALRFPRLIRLRDDKSVDECTNISEVEDAFYEQK